jgi:hypothetical protein
MLLAPPQLLRHGHVIRHVGLNVVAVDTVHHVLAKIARCQELDQFFRKQKIWVRRQDEFAPRPTDSNVLGDHLKQRHHVRVPQVHVVFRRDLNEAQEELVGARSHLDDVVEPRSRRRIPFDDEQFPGQPVLIGKLEKPFDEERHALRHLAAVIIVSTGYDKAQPTWLRPAI